MRSLKNRAFRFGFGLRIFVVLMSLFLIGFAFFQFPTNASKKKNASAKLFQTNKLLDIEDFNLESKTTDSDFKFKALDGEFSAPRLIDYQATTGNLLISSEQPAKLELFSKISRQEFISNEFFNDKNFRNPQSLATVREKTGGFAVGEVFLGFENGTIFRVSADALQITKINLPREKSMVNGGLTVDQTKVFGGDLLAATGDGKIWRVDQSGNAKLFLDLNTAIKGLTIIPNDFERYGAIAGKLIVGAGEQRGIFAIDENASTIFFPLDIKPQDIDLIERGENLFAVSSEKNKLFSLDAQNFSNKHGDILIASAESKEFYVLHWNGAEFQVSTFKADEKINQMTFAPLKFEDGAGNCVTSLSQVENVFQWEGEFGSFEVIAPSNCNWTAMSNADWLKLFSGQSGTGNGTVQYFVTKNGTNLLRDANISVDTLTHRVRQSKKAMVQCNAGADAGNQNIGAAGGNGSISINGNPNCAWKAESDSPWLTLTGNIFGAGNGTVSYTATTNFTAQTRQAKVSFAGGTATVTQSPNLAPNVNAGTDQTITLPNTASLNGTASDDGIGNAVTVSWSKISGDESVLFSAANNLNTTAIFSKNGVYVLRLTASDGYLTATDDIQITVNSDPTPPPPDPTTTAPTIDQTVPTNIAKSTEFLYTGANPIQTGVNPSDIKAERVGLLRGRVVSKSGQPIPNVKISILDHTEFGQTRSRADGMFDLVVNGGGDLTVKYEKQGYISSQREEKIDWQNYSMLEDVVLIPFDGNVSFIDLNSTQPIQTAESGVISDADGTRRSRLFFKQGTTATMTLPNNSTLNLTEMHVRSTEFTVGNNGAETMPGDLPPTSAYTYASEYSVDEAVALNAKNITFSQPVVQYNENFLGFPVGIDVPSGSYDQITGDWIPSANGRVVKILSVTSGAANLDLDGSGNPADENAYNALGINLAERERLAAIYTVNQTLWRVPIIHFTSWDSNWGFGPPDDAEPPNSPPPTCDSCKCDSCELEGSIIDVQNQALSEELPITGTSFFLRYDSERQRGRTSNRSLIIPLSGTTVPASLKNINLTVELLGRTFEQTFPPTANLNTVFNWDGMDAYGRTVQGSHPATLKIAFVYDGVYQQTYNFGSPGTGVQITGSFTRREIEFVQRRTVYVSNIDSSKTGGIGGWTLNVHHVYDPNEKALFQGDGKRRSVQSINDILKNSAGNGNFGFNGDGGQASQAELSSPSGVAFAPDGSYFIADSSNNRIRKVSTNGIISTVAGDGNICNPLDACGDGGQATIARLANPTDVQIGKDGSLYISDTDSNRIRRVAPNGIISTIVGTGEECVPTDACGDDGAAISAKLNKPQHINLASDGTLFIADSESRRVRRVATDGKISTVAGSGLENCLSDNVPARNACLGKPMGVAQASDGSLYISDDNGETDRIYRLGTNGIIKIVSNGIVCNNALTEKDQIGEIGPLRICDPNSLAVGAGDNLFVASSFNGNVFKIAPSGIRSIIAGTTKQGLDGDGQPALQARLDAPKGVAIAPNGNILVAEQNGHRVRNIQSLLPSFTGQDYLIPSSDGSELFQFDRDGKHLKTVNALTNADQYVFGYDASGRLISVTDGDGNVTTIERNGTGNPTGILSPYNQLTALTLDANGYLATVANPANESNQFTYTAEGLMLMKRDALNRQSTFTYDSLGRLLRDDDAATGFQTLLRSQTSNSYTVTHDTSLNRVSTFKVEDLPNGDIKNTNTLPDGTQTVKTDGANGVNTTNFANGTITESTLAPDPRWAMLAPIRATEKINTSNGVSYNSTFASEVVLLNPFNPLSLVSKTDTFMLNGKTYTSVFTVNNLTFSDTSPFNRQKTTVIDSQNRPTQIQFANLHGLNFTYDTRGRLSTITSGTGLQTRTSTFSYNPAGFLSSSTNPLNQTDNFTYDLAGRLTQQIRADNRIIGFGYDANSNRTSVTPPSRPAHIFAYNTVNLVSSYTAPNVGGNSTTTYQYNLDKQITNITRPDGLQFNYAYDTAGRLQSLTVPNGTYGFAYNATTGLVETITAPDGGNLAFEYGGFLPTRQTWSGTVTGNVSQTFNNDFLVSSQTINDANTVNFTYDDDGLLTSAGNLTLTGNAQNGLLTATALGNVTDTFAYNGFGEPTAYNAKFNATTLYDVTYIYNNLGRISQKTETIGGVTTVFAYGYDLTGRLTTVTLNGAPQPLVTYGYDNNDNRTSINLGGNITNAAYDNQDRLTNYGAATYGYTPNGERQSKTNGASVTQYNYDVFGNLRTVTLPDATQIEYLIDGQNRRIGKKINGALTQGFLYQNDLEPVAELDASNNIVSRFVYGTRSNTPDYMSKNGATYRIITDQLGSVRLVVDVSTGNIAQRIDYDEFGVVLLDTNPNFQPFGFAGGIYDSNTKLTRFGARDYDAETGSWTTKDAALFSGGTSNLYQYAFSDPINFIDLTGLEPAQANSGANNANNNSNTQNNSNNQTPNGVSDWTNPQNSNQEMVFKPEIPVEQRRQIEQRKRDILKRLEELDLISKNRCLTEEENAELMRLTNELLDIMNKYFRSVPKQNIKTNPYGQTQYKNTDKLY